MKAKLTPKDTNIEDRLKGMLTRAGLLASFMQRVTLQDYIDAQKRRFETKNSSEGATWKSLNEQYAERKARDFADAPGGGKEIMIRTGNLYFNAIGRGSGFRKEITNSKFIVGIDPAGALDPKTGKEYVQYAAEVRPFMEFSELTLSKWRKKIADYVEAGK